MFKLKFILFVLSLLVSNMAFAKDKSVANQYPVILEVSSSGVVENVVMQNSTPKSIRDKALKTFIGRQVAVKRVDGKQVPYQQKFSISTKHLVDNTQITKR